MDGKLARERREKTKRDDAKWKKTYGASLKTKEATKIRNQRQLLIQKFLDSKGELTKKEKVAYTAYKTT